MLYILAFVIKQTSPHIFLQRKGYFYEIEYEENEVVFFLLSFSDLSHHRTSGSAYGGFAIYMHLLIKMR